MVNSLHTSPGFLLGMLGLVRLAESAWPANQFVTEPSIKAPQLHVQAGAQQAPGYIFLGPRNDGANASAPLIYDQMGNLVYQGTQGTVANFGVQMYNNAPVITYWEGTMLDRGFGYGSVHVLDNTYKEIATVTLPSDLNFVSPDGNSYPSYIDLHESQFTPSNTVLVTAYNSTQTDLTSVGGSSDGWILDTLFYEIDIASNKILNSWSALDNIDQIGGFASAHQQLEGTGGSQALPWDAFHLNSVAPTNNGYIISIRHFFSAYLLDKNGTVSWRLDVSQQTHAHAHPKKRKKKKKKFFFYITLLTNNK